MATLTIPNIQAWTSNNKPRVCVFDTPTLEGDCPIINLVLEADSEMVGYLVARDDEASISYSASELMVYTVNLLIPDQKYQVTVYDSGIPMQQGGAE